MFLVMRAHRHAAQHRDDPDRVDRARHLRERPDPLLLPLPRRPAGRRRRARARATRCCVAGRAILFATLDQRRRLPRLRASPSCRRSRQFGMLAALAFVLSMIADFTALPAALWILFREKPRDLTELTRRMFPYHDENETQRFPIITVVLIALNVPAWVPAARCRARKCRSRSRSVSSGSFPAELLGTRGRRARHSRWATASRASPIRAGRPGNILTSMFLHGSWMHLHRQHVVPLALREQHRGRDDPAAVRRLLSGVAGFAAALAQVFDQPDVGRADGRARRARSAA